MAGLPRNDIHDEADEGDHLARGMNYRRGKCWSGDTCLC